VSEAGLLAAADGVLDPGVWWAAVSEQPQHRRPGMINYVAAADFNHKILRP
jgi:hypothetical protein